MAVTQFRWGKTRESRKWSNQETAEFYRVTHFLDQAGLPIITEQGVSDEGDPWLVFVKADTDDVIAHIARIDGKLIAVSSLTQLIFEGDSVRDVVEQMLKRHPMMMPAGNKNNGKLFLHPGAGLAAFVAAAYFMILDSANAERIGKDFLENAQGKERDNQAHNKGDMKTLEHEPLVERKTFGRALQAEDMMAFSQMAVLGASIRFKQALSEDLAVTTPQTAMISEVSNIMVDQALRLIENPRTFDEGIVSSSKIGPVQSPLKNLSKTAIEGNSDMFNAPLKTIEKNDPNGLWPLVESDMISSQVIVSQEKSAVESQLDFLSLRGLNNNLTDGFDFSNTANKAVSNYQSVELPLQLKVFNFQDLFSDIRHTFEKEVLKSIETSAATIQALSVSLDADSKFSVFLFETASDAKDDNQEFLKAGNTDVPLGSMEEPAIDTLTYNGNLDASMAANDDSAVHQIHHETLVHQVRTSGQAKLELDGSTDIIFYWGGDLEVSNFELGKDMFWLFLSDRDVLPDKGEALNGSDLVLSFGQENTITFLGLLDSSGSSDFI